MNWIPGFCLLAGITLVAAVWFVIDKWASRYLQGHLDRIDEQSNVTVLDTARAPSNVIPLIRRNNVRVLPRKGGVA